MRLAIVSLLALVTAVAATVVPDANELESLARPRTIPCLDGAILQQTLNQCQIRSSDGSYIADEVCASTYCTDGKCAESAQGKPCDSAKDCAFRPGSVDVPWLCPADKKICHQKQLATGKSCTDNEECLHNQCTNAKLRDPRVRNFSNATMTPSASQTWSVDMHSSGVRSKSNALHPRSQE
ncbi:uncharacterized protein EURHEDRAFT_379433 [Aspergillus ruber CBS 135680]|uniref:Uncharacterized protein n=1 Tax=Aspergillus ruber (strain CBS 135680) TaxID=1388766 RepID=A0A017S8J2_ASPRC|nr:uncharacterized protein EURHEDRAFT_379433 [Aspergillus ruber CBS 135680]EYE93373.1 hypothetical protein EURHEDRAFT_379433 [Aspergillus ruber CBS 135680]